jgi:hypothetical protein
MRTKGGLKTEKRIVDLKKKRKETDSSWVFPLTIATIVIAIPAICVIVVIAISISGPNPSITQTQKDIYENALEVIFITFSVLSFILSYQSYKEVKNGN